MNNLRHSLRSLYKSPGFLVTALATLAICLGANLTIFAVVDAILLKPLPFPDSERLVTLYYTYPRLPSANSGASLTNYYERRGQIPALSSIAAISKATSVVGETGATSIEKLGRVTPEFFATLGIKPLMGRVFTDAEMTYQTDHVAMLAMNTGAVISMPTRRFWENRSARMESTGRSWEYCRRISDSSLSVRRSTCRSPRRKGNATFLRATTSASTLSDGSPPEQRSPTSARKSPPMTPLTPRNFRRRKLSPTPAATRSSPPCTPIM
jgi:hypothetical protein